MVYFGLAVQYACITVREIWNVKDISNTKPVPLDIFKKYFYLPSAEVLLCVGRMDFSSVQFTRHSQNQRHI